MTKPSQTSVQTQLLTPSDASPYFSQIVTRATALPPENMRLSVLQVAHYCAPKGELIPLHTTYYCWLAWIVRGHFSVRGYNWHREASAGFCITGGPGETASAYADIDQSEGYTLLMDGPDCCRILRETGLWPAVFPYRTDPRLWLEIIAERISTPSEQSRAASCGHSLFVSLRRDAQELTPDPLVFSVCQYIQENWHLSTLNVDSLLAYFSIARSTLAPRFKRITGTSILEYIMSLRCQKAIELLTTSRNTIHQIAQQTGFTDASYFATWFKKRTGQSPGQFRRKNNHDNPLTL